MSGAAAALDALLARARAGEDRALARLISVAERGGPDGDALAARTAAVACPAHVVGVTGPPGAGKSSLTGRVVALLAAAGHRPAVLAVDPSSPHTGGALLADRVRMEPLPDGAFVRSMATRGARGGLARAVPEAVRLAGAAGHDPVIVETAGVGQVELDIAGSADTVVVVVAPGAGDALQANKAGLLEVADVLVVNKADRPGAADARRDLALMLDLGRATGLEARTGWRPEVVETVATTGEGVDALVAAIARHRSAAEASGELAARRRARLVREARAGAEAALTERLDAVLAGDHARAWLDARAAGRLSVTEHARLLAEAARAG